MSLSERAVLPHELLVSDVCRISRVAAGVSCRMDYIVVAVKVAK